MDISCIGTIDEDGCWIGSPKFMAEASYHNIFLDLQIIQDLLDNGQLLVTEGSKCFDSEGAKCEPTDPNAAAWSFGTLFRMHKFCEDTSCIIGRVMGDLNFDGLNPGQDLDVVISSNITKVHPLVAGMWDMAIDYCWMQDLVDNGQVN